MSQVQTNNALPILFKFFKTGFFLFLNTDLVIGMDSIQTIGGLTDQVYVLCYFFFLSSPFLPNQHSNNGLSLILTLILTLFAL